MTQTDTNKQTEEMKRAKEPPRPPRPPRELIHPTDHSGRRTEHDVHDDDLL